VAQLGEAIKVIAVIQFMRIIERFVKNNTPYLGELILRIEKEPNYESTKKGFLNKTHFDFKIFKLVTRLIPKLDERGWVADPEKVALIEKYTGGIVKEKIEADNENESGYTRKYIFLSKNKKYVGDLFKGWWYYQNQMMITEERPGGISVKYKDKKIEGYYIITETESLMVKIGDRIFDERYRPSQSDFKKEEWDKWEKKFTKFYNKSKDWKQRRLKKVGILLFMPYNKRGFKKIKTNEEAKETAIKIYDFIIKNEHDKK
jgi:hypothetical protein